MMKTLSLLSLGSLLLFATMVLPACNKDVDVATDQPSPQPAVDNKNNPAAYASNEMVLFWNEKAATVVTGPITPPAQSRFIAMIQIAVHDALNSIKPKYETHALLNTREKDADPRAAVASAAYWTIKGMNIQASHPIDTWLAQSLATIPDGEAKTLGIALGKQSAEAIIAKRLTDNFAIANLQQPRPDGVAPGEYRSTLPFSNAGMPKIKALHQWGTMMLPFVTQSNSQFRPMAPIAVSSPEYLAEFNEAKLKGGSVGHTRTADETEIGVFWVERSTIGWNRLARNIIAGKNIDAWRTARLFALLHTAMTDAISGTFEAKYYYSYWRPETAIRLGDSDGNPYTIGDPNWLPSYIETPAAGIYTPPIPDYPSAHASFGGAAAEVLRLFFGTNTVSVHQTSSTLPGVTRHYTSLSQAERDNSLSRVYVGFHFRDATLKGEKQGEDIGNYVFTHSFREAD